MISLPAKGPSATAGRAKTCPYLPIMSGRPGALYFPASPAPGLHPRKGAGRGKNPFLFAMLFEKNIEIFSDPNPSVLCVFSICLPPFRGWTQGAGREAGSAQGDAARNISANAPYLSTNQIGAQAEGAFSWHTLIGPLTLITYETEASGGLSFESSRVVPTAEENRPVNVALPVCIYLGLPA